MTGDAQSEVHAGLSACLDRLWRYGALLSGNRETAEDLVQATCVRALERARQFEAGSRLDSWMFAILRSIWLNEVRSRKARQGEGIVDAESELSFDGVARIETDVLAAQVMREVNMLPAAQREAVFLVYVEGLAYREAAAVLDVPIGTVMSRLAAARARLARLGADDGPGEMTEVERR